MSSSAAVSVEIVGREALLTRVKPSRGGGEVVAFERIDLGCDPATDPAAAGRAMKAALVGMGSGPLLGLLPRGRAIVRWIGLDDATLALPDLPDLIRSEVQASAASVEGDLLVDYLPAPSSGDEARNGEASGRSGVLAVGARGDDARAIEAVMRAAGRKLAGLTARPVGLGGLCDGDQDGFTLVAAVGHGGADLGAVEGGRLVAARPCVDLGRGVVDSLVVEVERLALAAGRRRRFDGARVIAEPDIAEDVAAALRERVKGRVVVVGDEGDGGVGCNIDRFGVDAAVHGLLLRRTGEAAIDLISPRRAPDPKEGARRTALLGLLGAVAVFGFAGVLAYKDLSRLDGEYRRLGGRLQELQGERHAVFRERARAEHLSRLIRYGEMTPLEELAVVHGPMPPAGPFLADSLRVVHEQEVAFKTRRSAAGKRRYQGGEWQSVGEAAVTIDGKTTDRKAGEVLREGLLDLGLYEVRPRGADVEDGEEVSLSRDLFAEFPEALAGGEADGSEASP